MADDFESDGKINGEAVSVAKAHLSDLVKAADEAKKTFGKDSNEYEVAKNKADDWARNVVKPMGTKWGEIGRTLQGETDLDTGSFVSVQRSVEDATSKPLTPKQEAEADKITTQVDNLNKQIKDLEDKYKKALENNKTKQTKEQTVKTKKSHEQYVKERQKAFDDAREALKKLRTGESGLGVSVPFARELAAVAPHIGKIVKSLIDEGIDKLEDIADVIHNELAKDLNGLRRKDVIDLIGGEYNKSTVISETSKYTNIKKQARLVKKLEDLQTLG